MLSADSFSIATKADKPPTGFVPLKKYFFILPVLKSRVFCANSYSDWGNSFHDTLEEALCTQVFGNAGFFKLHGGSHATARAVIVTSALNGFISERNWRLVK